MSSQGNLKSFNQASGFGFITSGEVDYLFHRTDIQGKPPKEGDVLSFDIAPSKKDPSKMEAKNVTGGTAGGNTVGTVKFFNEAKGYGFIEDDGVSHFLHATDISGGTPMEGDKVWFDIVPSEKDPAKTAAKNVVGGSGYPMGQGYEEGYGIFPGEAMSADAEGIENWEAQLMRAGPLNSEQLRLLFAKLGVSEIWERTWCRELRFEPEEVIRVVRTNSMPSGGASLATRAAGDALSRRQEELQQMEGRLRRSLAAVIQERAEGKTQQEGIQKSANAVQEGPKPESSQGSQPQVQAGPQPEAASPVVPDQSIAATSTKLAASPGSQEHLPRQRAKATCSGDRFQDPKFVFRVCDADGSNNLSEHELPFALRAFGLCPNKATLKQALKTTLPLGESDFAALVSELKAALPEDQRCDKAVPHGLRGMTVEQLQRVDATFVSTGWLQGRCDDFNRTNASEIKAGRKFNREANLYALDPHVIQPLTKPALSEAHSCDAAGHFPMATHTCSFSELLNPDGIELDFFVSHYWKHLFQKTLQALLCWAKMAYAQIGRTGPQHVSFWLCIFALNQHQVAIEVGTSPSGGPFNAAIFQSKGAVMVVGEDLGPFFRIWCIFEVHRLKELKKAFELICDSGPISSMYTDASDTESKDAAARFLKTVGQKLLEVSAVTAQSSSETDKQAILSEVINPEFKMPGFINPEDFGLLEAPFFFSVFDRHVKGLLAGPMLAASVSQADAEGVFTWCQQGAKYSDAELALVDLSQANLQLLLEAAATHGQFAEALLLLERGADAANCNALWNSAHTGQTALLKLLLEAKADVLRMHSELGTPAAYIAAWIGHSEALKVLVEAR
ncbi:unnamed protein product, partial [Polarella glacialis]